jgi:hypothetical protein
MLRERMWEDVKDFAEWQPRKLETFMHDEGAGEEIKIHAIFYNDV